MMKTNQLQTQQSQSLTASQRSVEIRLRDLGLESDAVERIIAAVYAKKNTPIPGETKEDRKQFLAANATALTNDVVKRFHGSTLADLSTAMQNGVLGDYGEFYGLSIVTFIGWMRSWWNSPERREAKQAQPQSSAALPPVSEQTKAQLVELHVQKAWETFKANGTYNDIGNVVYDYLDKKGELRFTADEKNMFMEQAKAHIQLKASEKGPLTIRNMIRRTIESMEHPGEAGYLAAVVLAKKMALEEHFRRN